MLQQVRRDRSPKVGETHPSRLEVGRVPQDNSTGDEIERARTMALGLQRMIADTADAMEEDGPISTHFLLPPC